jgi:Na+/H+-dicarboxylate symporter
MGSGGRAWYREVHWQILLAMLLGVVAGTLLGEAASWLSPLAEIFLRLLRMVIVPLVLSSLIVGTTGIGDATKVGRLGLKAGVYYVLSSGAAILAGLLAVNVVRPGVGADLPVSAAVPDQLAAHVDSLSDIIVRVIPDNPIRAMVDGDMLGIIFFALLVGLFTNRLPVAPRRLISDFAAALFDLMMHITDFVIRLAPLGVFALMARLVGTAGLEVFGPLFLYMATVLGSLAVHALVTLPLALWTLGGRPPWAYARALAPALLTAFSSSSSSATLPLTLDCVERRAGVPNQVSSFVLPLGATVNMDGTALYECVAAIFIAQVYGISLSLGQQAVVFATALLASIGAAGIPMAGLVMMAVVLRAVGLPLEGVGLILAVDRVLDMCRTTVNVWSDTVGAAIVARWEGYEILPPDGAAMPRR